MSSQFWDRAASIDPMWAVLSDPAKRGRQWRTNEFFATGRREVSLLLYQLSHLSHSPRTGSALDFGCGLGRLTQALAATFEWVVGVDVSANMVSLANRLNQFGPRVTYLLNDRPDLSRIQSASFDLVYSDIVLQHIPSDQSRVYVAEFVRVLRPGGIAVFQLPSELIARADRQPGPTAMTDSAYRATIACADGAFLSLEPGARADLVVHVTNTSECAWDQGASGAIRLGNHWLSAEGTMLIQDDGRAQIPAKVASGQGATVGLSVTAPRDHGRYLCELDLVHEGVTWFGDRGSRSLRLPVVVGSGTGGTARTVGPSSDPVYPEIDDVLDSASATHDMGEFPMYGIPSGEVLALLQSAGADCFFMEPDERGGPEWTGYRYFVKKR